MVCSGDPGERIVIVGFVGLGSAGLLRNKRIGNKMGEHTALQAAALDGGHGVGGDVKPVAAVYQKTAYLFCVGKRIDPGAQCCQIVPVGCGGIPIQSQRPEKPNKPLQRDEFLGNFSPVEGVP